MAGAPEPEELSREELETEIMRLRELEGRVERLETLVGTLGDTPPEKAGLQDVALVGEPIGKLVDKNNQRFKQLEAEVQAGESGQPRLGGSRDEMVPAHRMWGDLITGAAHSLTRTQERAARIFGKFVRRVVDDEYNKIDATGQMYTLSSGAAEEILLGKIDEDSENLLNGVKEASRSQVIARAMRDVARLSKTTDCECVEIDDCAHANIRFRAGKPNRLAAPKQLFNELMANVYGEDTDTADDEDHPSEALPEDESEKRFKKSEVNQK